MKKRVLPLILLVGLLGMNTSGCSSTPSSVLPIIASYVTDAAMVLGTVQQFVDTYFATHPDPAKQKQVDDAIKKAKTALDAAQKALAGASELTQAQVTAAFADFVAAYNDLMALVGPLGVTVQDPAGKALKAAPGQLLVPPAAVLVPKVQK